MKKCYSLAVLLLILITCISHTAYSQALAITGKVVDSRNNPLPGASVLFVEGNLNGQTNQVGAFQFPVASPGTYNLVVSMVGYAKQQLRLDVQPGQPDFTVVLAEKVNELQGV